LFQRVDREPSDHRKALPSCRYHAGCSSESEDCAAGYSERRSGHRSPHRG
jgi:hypothetical protein